MKSTLEPEDFELSVQCPAQNCHLGFVPGGKKCSTCYGKGMIQTRLGTHLTGIVMDALFESCQCVTTLQKSCRKCHGRKVVLTNLGELLCSFVRQQIHAPKSFVDHASVVSKSPAETKAPPVDTISHTKASEGAKVILGAPTHVPGKSSAVYPVPGPSNGSASQVRPGTVSKRRDLVDVRLP